MIWFIQPMKEETWKVIISLSHPTLSHYRLPWHKPLAHLFSRTRIPSWQSQRVRGNPRLHTPEGRHRHPAIRGELDYETFNSIISVCKFTNWYDIVHSCMKVLCENKWKFLEWEREKRNFMRISCEIFRFSDEITISLLLLANNSF